ncbi:hypothetical protein L4D76_22800 [Photobacterium sagamiensis]|uniref:hypothetical protein n=1 Tax=Photobacterium sagamiensis TaxID=2910241 RepID=UPI003D0F6DB1
MMKKMKPITRNEVSQLTCDKCGFTASSEDAEFHEFLCIDKTGGYNSVFGDGNHIELDLCQDCLKELLGSWIRISAKCEDRKSWNKVFEEEQVEDDFLSERDDVPPGRIGD